MEKTIDNRKAKSEATQRALMQAAEKLIAERGVENISIREIVAKAGQKNESALQYHFKNLTGLLNAIHDTRAQQVRLKRADLLEAALATEHQPTLRQLCALMVEPTFLLARNDASFRRYIKAFGHKLALSETSPLKVVANKGGGGQAGQRLATLLKEAVPHLDGADYRCRMDAAVTLCSAAMYQQARAKNAFRGDQSDLFFNNLIDALCGMLAAPVSQETAAVKAKR